MFRSERNSMLDAPVPASSLFCAKTTLWRTGGGRPPPPPPAPRVAIPRTRADKETNNCSPRRLAECALVAPMLVCTCACVRVCVRVFFILSPSRRGVHKERPNRTLALASASASASAMTLPGCHHPTRSAGLVVSRASFESVSVRFVTCQPWISRGPTKMHQTKWTRPN